MRAARPGLKIGRKHLAGTLGEKTGMKTTGLTDAQKRQFEADGWVMVGNGKLSSRR